MSNKPKMWEFGGYRLKGVWTLVSNVQTWGIALAVTIVLDFRV